MKILECASCMASYYALPPRRGGRPTEGLTKAKYFQQKLWKHKLDWDTLIPEKLREEWHTIVDNANGFERIFNRRCIGDTKLGKLAVFADASTIIMSACAYIFDEGQSELVMGKAKLPSIRSTVTIPKMELNALTLAVRLANSTRQALSGIIWNIYIFSDSRIALSWLSASPHDVNLGVLVNNRLKEIRRIVEACQSTRTTVHFKFIQTKENPADAGTRGLTQKQLRQSIWWTGPKFSRDPIDAWSNLAYPIKNEEMQPFAPESAAVNALTMNRDGAEPASLLDWSRFSSLLKAKRTLVVVSMFVKKLLKSLPEQRRKSILDHIPEFADAPESFSALGGPAIRASRPILVKNHQSIYLTEEYRKSMDNTLRLFQDHNGFWRSKGRIGKSALHQDAKDPILILPRTPLAKLIIHDTHGIYHQGVEQTIATVRSQYWIPKSRQQVRHAVKHCVQCRRFNGLPYAYPTTCDLPDRRMIRSYTFEHVGVDFFDLPLVKENDEEAKAYGCIFTCAVTRLIHLELARDMSTESFLNALRRFIARRGVPKTITSDNAPTFLLSASILSTGSGSSQLHPNIGQFIAHQEIEWKTITPYAPWQGGFYERLIKSIKHALLKSLRGKPHRSPDGLATVLTEVEACLNTRPLTYQSSELDSLNSIRPIDFIQRDLILSFPYDPSQPTDDPDYLPSRVSTTIATQRDAESALKSSCQITDRFWKIWQHNYLTSLRETHKKLISSKRHHQLVPKVGTVVLLYDPVRPRNEWKLARITETHPGNDGQIREVELFTSTKRKIRRPVNLIVPLQLEDSEKTPSKEENITPIPENQNNSTEKTLITYDHGNIGVMQIAH